ncbi:hypothetical protein J2755_001300 [Methanohalophilus levihalophilus]|uniref:hypothetical protein n=1 Tax=Methanohalophilus levihalophilus TaxID=1431282 RepID=UPI001AE87F20|nr:hypothetical protein [Methanohalophilus levihalophilus]MBP2030366.1 hypothetical protein [Methanohalophilus levihalophilus]
MTIHNIGLIHECTIISRTQMGTDEYGSPVYAENSTLSSCRFLVSADPSRIDVLESGEHSVSEVSVILPSGVVVETGDTISSTVPGYSHSYEILSVTPITRLFNSTVHHYECKLKAVE